VNADADAGDAGEGAADDSSDAADSEDGAAEEGTEEVSSEGNSYVASITPNGIAKAGFKNEFTITFQEVGEKAIGSVRIDLPNSIDDWLFNPDTDITSPAGKSWTGGLVGYVLEMWATDSTSFIDKNDGDGISATLCGTPKSEGGYKFETKAYTDADGIDPATDDGVGIGVGTSTNKPAKEYEELYPAIPGNTEELWVGVRNTIQEAINVNTMLDGGTVHVNPGTYEESNILVNKSLTIEGIGSTRDEVVVVPAAEDGNKDNAFGDSAQNGFIIAANDVTIRNLTLDGRGNTALTEGKNT